MSKNKLGFKYGGESIYPIETETETETAFHDWIVNREVVACNKKALTVLDSKVSLWKPIKILTEGFQTIKGGKGMIGQIDLVFRYNGKYYVGEIKYIKPSHSSDSFWGAVKALAYCVYYNWQTDLTREVFFHPAIFIPKRSIKLEHKIISSKLDIEMFGIERDKKEWKIEYIR